ncbi:galactoside-binding lectin [Ancylostoma duodenale]|uniref:Galectin n=1 Tax=Ancylostoma duodenale TaxID=51022 RepID=A0A0C2GTE7_9BILA|nr:galactoside-binding lectin [Ancylostoma duodenale]
MIYIIQVPYAADIPGNFYAGRRLFVSGIVPKAAKQFSIDFHAGTELATRIKTIFPMKKVLRTSRTNDRWGPEERIGDADFPFKRKHTFDLLIYCGENKFEIFVNDCPFASIDHRVPSNQINKLSIDGDIVLLGVHLK